MEIFTYQGLMALLQVIGIDLVLAGDNAIVIALAARSLPHAPESSTQSKTNSPLASART